jgi:hypothetical protein
MRRNRAESSDLRGRGAGGVVAVAVRDADHLGNPGEAVGDQKGTAADRDQCYAVCPASCRDIGFV